MPRAPRSARARPRRPPADLRALLRRCHERLYGRGVAHAEEDLTMDMVRLLLAKTLDEEEAAARPAFACTPAEAATEAGRAAVAARVAALFDRVRRRHAGVFGADERITVGPRAVVDVVLELQHHRLRGEADLLGEAYEEYTATHLKRQRGQFFTNRLVVDLVTGILDPAPGALVLDPAGGSGGFLTGAVRHARRAGRAGPGGLV
ncbi:MAG TPA: N-6 DNA methylase, partial [Polyangia bacterium]